MSCDIDAIKARLDAARFAAHAGMSLSEEAAAWKDLNDHAAGDIAFLLEALDETRERLVTVRHELDMARETQQSVRVAYDKLANMDRAFQSLYTSAVTTRAENAVLRGQVDDPRAELDARDLDDLPMGGA